MRNPLHFLLFFGFKLTVRQWVFWILFIGVLLALVPIFFYFVEPSLLGYSDLRIYVDSPVYLFHAGLPTDWRILQYSWHQDISLEPDLDWAGMVSLTSNHLGPVAIAFLMGSNFRIMLFNYGLFGLSLWCFSRLKNIRLELLAVLLLVNPFIPLSIMTLNKEIIILLASALLALYLQSRSPWLIPLVLTVSFLARWEMAAFFVIWRLIESRFNPFRGRRGAVIALMIAGITFIYPHISPNLDSFYRYAEDAGRATHILNNLQDHYLYALAFIPKLVITFDQAWLAPWYWVNVDSNDIVHYYAYPLNGLLMTIVFIVLLMRRRLRLASDNIYASAILAVIFSASPIFQARYMLSVYFLCCVELCTVRQFVPYVWESRFIQAAKTFRLSARASPSKISA